MQESLFLWSIGNQMLFEEMEQWRNNYRCSKNCVEWQKWAFCSHLTNARERKFGKEIKAKIHTLACLNAF